MKHAGTFPRPPSCPPPGRESLWGLLSVRAVLAGGVGAAWLRLLAVLAGGHALVDPVQPASLLEVPDLPRGRETLDGCRGERERERRCVRGILSSLNTHTTVNSARARGQTRLQTPPATTPRRPVSTLTVKP